MLSNFFLEKLSQNFKYEPTKGQAELLVKLTDFILSAKKNHTFILKGYAGTGKTTLMSALVKTLNQLEIKTLLLAPTGRAAKVFSLYSEKAAFTIHKKIYRQKSANDAFGRFGLNFNTNKDTIFIVDEASMISNQSSDINAFGSGRLLEDLLKFVFETDNNCKLILLGDTAQLPPVGVDLSPALDVKEIEALGLSVDNVELTEVVRQTEKSGILFNATYLRKLILDINEMDKFPKLEIKRFSDIERVTGENLIDKITESYDKVGLDNTLIVTRSNDRANRFNQGIRNTILWREDEISVGDVIMIVKNNYFWIKDNESIDFLANGDTAEIIRIRGYENLYDFRFATVVLKFQDYNNLQLEVKILLDTLSIKSASLTSEDNNKLYKLVSEDYLELNNKREIYKRIKENPHFNALQIKFAYSVTCHKSQGGQWKHVFIDQGYLTDEMINVEYLRWLYTAVTRATEKVFLVNFKDDFFKD